MVNVILTGLAIVLIIASVAFGFVTIKAIMAWNSSTTLRGHRVRGVVSLIIEGLVFTLAIWMLINYAPRTGGSKSADAGSDATPSASAAAADADDSSVLPDGAFAVDFSEDDLLKAMKIRFGDDFSWEKYQNDFSDDLFPSKYQERRERSQQAMSRWYGKKKQGFSDPVWFPMDNLISIYHSDKWNKMGDDAKLAYIDKIILECYDQILRNPRYCEMFVEFFYELADDFPEIVERNKSWLPAFKDWYAKANDVDNKVKNADGKEIVAGVSVFFEPVNSADDAKILQKDYVMNAARICLMFDEFVPAKMSVQSPKSKINWHLAFGKDAATAKVGILTDPKDQEKEPALIFLYRYKGGTRMKIGLNIFDRRLEIFPLETPKAKKEPPIKEKEPPARNPQPRNNPTPNKVGPPTKVVKPTPTAKPPKKTPKPGKNQYAPLTVHFKTQSGVTLKADYKKTYKVGKKYSYTGPKQITKGGVTYTAINGRTVSGNKMPKSGVDYTIYYKAPDEKVETYKFTVYYKYRDGGGTVFSPTTSTHKAGDKFTVKAKTKSGYYVDGATAVSVQQPAGNSSYTFWYIKKKNSDNRPSGGNVPDGPLKKDDGDGDPRPTKPPKEDYKPVPAQPTKKPDTKPTQKPNAPAGNGSSSGSGKTDPIPVHKDTNATVTNPDGSTTTSNTADGKPNGKVPAPAD